MGSLIETALFSQTLARATVHLFNTFAVRNRRVRTFVLLLETGGVRLFIFIYFFRNGGFTRQPRDVQLRALCRMSLRGDVGEIRLQERANAATREKEIAFLTILSRRHSS